MNPNRRSTSNDLRDTFCSLKKLGKTSAIPWSKSYPNL